MQKSKIADQPLIPISGRLITEQFRDSNEVSPEIPVTLFFGTQNFLQRFCMTVKENKVCSFAMTEVRRIHAGVSDDSRVVGLTRGCTGLLVSLTVSEYNFLAGTGDVADLFMHCCTQVQ